MKKYILALFCAVIVIGLVGTQVSFYDNFSNALNNRYPLNLKNANNYYQILSRTQPTVQDKVQIKLYYESMCPDCRLFDSQQFAPVVAKLGLYLDIFTYPYGNAQTIVHQNGSFDFQCQHGPPECYGNKLHACAIFIMGGVTSAYVPFNSCMMDRNQNGKGSDDTAADVCGRRYNIDSNAIKQCAKGAWGSQLLKYYGDESKKVGFGFVPYILINGVPNDGSNLLRDVCKAFKHKPQECYGVTNLVNVK